MVWRGVVAYFFSKAFQSPLNKNKFSAPRFLLSFFPLGVGGKNKTKIMKLTKLITMCALSSVLTSCTITCYQVFSTKPTTKNIVVKEKSMLYSDDVCAISYNFWCNGGDPGFLVFNKTNEKLYINLKESFFTLNGIAYDYYEKGSSFSVHGHAQTKATSKTISEIEYRPYAILLDLKKLVQS